MVLVVDASVAMGWFVASQATPLTYAALSHAERESALVPSHFAIEVARSLRTLERRSLIDSDRVGGILSRLRDLRLKQDTRAGLDTVELVVTLARKHRLRVADAAYVELASRVAATLATRDVALAAAAGALGVQLFTTAAPG